MQSIPELLTNASALIESGKLDDAERVARKALSLEPENSVALHILGVVARQSGRLDLAIQSLNQALHTDPDHPGIHFELGASFHQAHRLDEARESFRRATELKPDFQEAFVNLGTLAERMDQPEQGLISCETAIRLQPDCYIARFNLGNNLRALGRLSEAAAQFVETIQLKPEFAKAHWNLACCALLAGDFKTGWHEYEWRATAGEVSIDHYTQPRWNGESLAGKHLLIHAEQGIGDEILFASCWPDLIPQAERCVIVCDPRLQRLFARSFPTAIVHGSVRHKDRRPANVSGRVDFQTPAGSVPRFFRQSAETFSKRQRILVADPSARRNWRKRYEQLGDGLKVGISWQAGGQPTERRKRTMTLDQWQGILRIPGAHFINLQYGDAFDELETTKQLGIDVHDWPDADPLLDLDAFAAKVAALDLVISVGNATVHMAGALGVPTWNLLPKVPGWRWMIAGEQSIWYPSVRLIRQRERGQWQPVLEQVERELADTVAARGLVSQSAVRTAAPPTASTHGILAADASTANSPSSTIFASSLLRLSDVPVLIERANEAFRRGDHRLAESLCRDVLNHAPRNVVALRLLGLIARSSGRADFAVKVLARAAAIHDNDPQLHFQLALAQCDANRAADALEHFRRAAELDPNSADILLALGQTEWALGRTDEARRTFLAATQAAPALAKAFNALGVAQMASGQATDAETSLRKAVSLQADYLAAWNNLGSLLRQCSRTSEAIECFRRVVQQDPNFAQASAALHALAGTLHGASSSPVGGNSLRVDAAHDLHCLASKPLDEVPKRSTQSLSLNQD